MMPANVVTCNSGLFHGAGTNDGMVDGPSSFTSYFPPRPDIPDVETSSQSRFGQFRGKHHPISLCCIAPPEGTSRVHGRVFWTLPTYSFTCPSARRVSLDARLLVSNICRALQVSQGFKWDISPRYTKGQWLPII